MTYRCTKGCLNTEGQPKYHQNRRECPYEPKFGTPPPPPETPSSPGGGAGLPSAPAAPSIPKEKEFGVRVRPFKADAPGIQPTARRIPEILREPIPEYWVLDAEGARKAWRLGFGGLYWVIEKSHPFVCDYLEYPKNGRPPLPDRAKFELGISANAAADDPTSIVVKWPTWALKELGATSLEEAKALLDEVEFFSIIGDVIVTTGGYWADMYLESPKYKKAKEAAEAAERAKAPPKGMSPTPPTRPIVETTGREVAPAPLAA